MLRAIAATGQAAVRLMFLHGHDEFFARITHGHTAGCPRRQMRYADDLHTTGCTGSLPHFVAARQRSLLLLCSQELHGAILPVITRLAGNGLVTVGPCRTLSGPRSWP
jgi:hypothetical protein